MKSQAIIDSRLWIRLDLYSSGKANSDFQQNSSHRAHLGTQLLLYDKVIIPTHDFGIVPILIRWMGISTFKAAVQSGAIEFIRPKFLLGYAGNGVGILGFTILPTAKRPFNWWQEAIFGSMEMAPDLQLSHWYPSLADDERKCIVYEVLKKSQPVDWDNALFMKAIVHESYTDIIKSAELSQYVLTHEPRGTEEINLSRLSSITADQMRVLNHEQIKDGVDLVLRVAEINLEIVMANIYGDADIGTSVGADALIRSKLVRCGAAPTTASQFQRLLELVSIPDIRPVIESGALSFSEIWRLRESEEGMLFRAWLRKAGSEDERELEKAYVACLSKTPLYSSLPVRFLRFVSTSALGILNPIGGIAISALDSFFVERWLSGYSPKLFLEKIRKLPNGDESKGVG